MPVYVDSLMDWGWKKGKSCHLIADTVPELKEFAIKKLGMQERWIQTKSRLIHFDLTVGKRALAVSKGAIELDRTEFVAKMRELKAI